MMERKQHVWDVNLMGVESGDTATRRIRTFWSPTNEDAEYLVKNAAQAEHFVATGKKQKWMPTAATLVKADA